MTNTKRTIAAAAFALVLCMFAFGLGQYNDSGTVGTGGTTFVVHGSGGQVNHQLKTFRFENTDSTDSIQFCVNATATSGNCNHQLEPGEALEISGKQAQELQKFFYKATANTPSWKILATF